MVIRDPDRIRRVAERALAADRELLLNRWLQEISEDYIGYTIEHDLVELQWNERMRPGTVARVARYLDAPTRFLLLRGTKGLGKSSLAATIGTHLIHTGTVATGSYYSMPTLLNEFSFPTEGKEHPVTACSSTPLLVLDDIGAKTDRVSSHQERCIWAVLNHRSEHRMLTILTTNMAIRSSDEGIGLADWLGETAWDRVSGDLTLVEFTGESMRGGVD